MSRKALFFDIDGTLISEKTGIMPDSAKRALSETRKKGNLVFINSGRTLGGMKEVLPVIGTDADGYLCGCGTYLQVDGHVLYSRSISRERGSAIKKAIVDFGLDGVLEGVDTCYFQRELSSMPLIRKLQESAEQNGGTFGWEQWHEFDKFCVCADERSDREGFFAFLEPDIQVIDRGNDFYECVPRGHSKATAIDMVLKQLQIPKEDAYVFGDSSNDLACFQYAVNAVLMADHDAVLEKYATFVTKTVEEDGIEFAMKNLGLL